MHVAHSQAREGRRQWTRDNRTAKGEQKRSIMPFFVSVCMPQGVVI